MFIIIAGGALALLGLASAALLVAAPMGWVAASPGLSLWVLFPSFTLIGYALLVVGSRDPAVTVPTQLIAVPLLLLAVLAAIALVASGAGMVNVGGNTAPLWYVLVLGGTIGAIGSAALGRRGAT
jgi:hypothetical protein